MDGPSSSSLLSLKLHLRLSLVVCSRLAHSSDKYTVLNTFRLGLYTCIWLVISVFFFFFFGCNMWQVGSQFPN